MPVSSRLRSVLVCLPCLLLGSCRNDPPQGYFPLDQGLEWHYRVVSKTPTREEESRLTITNAGIRKYQGIDYHVRQTSNGNYYYLAENEKGVMRMGKRTLIEDRPRLGKKDRFVLKNPLQTGTSWSHQVKPYLLERTFETNRVLKRLIDYEMLWEILGTNETVKVPAGQFEHCIHVRGSAVIGVPRPLSVARDEVRFSTEEWYAPGVGLVQLEHKEEENSDQLHGGIITMKLEAFRH